MARGRKEKPAVSIPGRPQAPDHLNDAAKRIFEAVASELIQLNACVATDAHLIALYAESREYANELRRKIDESEATTKSEGYGALKRHPLIDPYLAALKSSALYLSKLNLTPSSRPKSVMGDDSVSEFHE